MEFDIADPPLPIMEFSIIFFIFLNEGFPYRNEISDFLYFTFFLGVQAPGRGLARCHLAASLLPES